MKAIVQKKYGSVDDLVLTEVPVPVPARDEVLVRVRAASVHADVWHVVTGLPYVLRLMGGGLLRPKTVVPGTDAAGVVEAVGGDVTRFRPGDEVFGETVRSHQWMNGGALAEYVAAPEFALAKKPEQISFEAAAAVPTAGLIALHNLRTEGRLRKGQHVLINGAAGGVGTIALQIAKALGAKVTAVDCASKLAVLRDLGADEVVDYEARDYTADSARYDLVFDVPGNRTLAENRRALRRDGTYVLIGHDSYGRGMQRWFGQLPRMMKLTVMSMFIHQLPKVNLSMPNKTEGMSVLRELLETHGLTPHIGITFPLDGVPDALRHMTSGSAIGKIVITI